MGRRIFAWVLDVLLYFGFAIAIFAIFAEYVEVPAGIGSSEACSLLQDQDDAAASGCFQLGDRAYITSTGENAIQSAASFGYFLFFVVLQGVAGGSPGKLLTGLRVVNEQGTRAGVGKSLVRTLLWIVDAAPWFLPLVGFIVGLTSTGHRRVGDMAAKTYVVSSKDQGTPPQPSHSAVPPGAQQWGAPVPGMAPPPPTGSPAATPPWERTATPAPGAPVDPAVPESIVPDVSGVPGDTPAPPSTAGISIPPQWDEPVIGQDAPPPVDSGPSAESQTPVDEPPPHVGVDPEWWSGPEATPEPDTPAADAGAVAPVSEPEPGPGEDPSPEPTLQPEWEPPTTPNADFGTTDDASPTAGPTPFVAPGTDPREQTPSSPQANPTPPPQWDQARNTYIQWDPNQQMWLQWDTVANRWKIIDT